MNIANLEGLQNLQCHIPKRGYVPGETIDVETQVENNSGKQITYVSHSFSKTKSENNILGEGQIETIFSVHRL